MAQLASAALTLILARVFLPAAAMPLLPALAFARSLIEGRLKSGGRALDGTAGNGHDTLLLARLAGEDGIVWAFDV